MQFCSERTEEHPQSQWKLFSHFHFHLFLSTIICHFIYPIRLGASFHDESFENNGQREWDRVRLEVCGDGDRQVGDGGDVDDGDDGGDDNGGDGDGGDDGDDHGDGDGDDGGDGDEGEDVDDDDEEESHWWWWLSCDESYPAMKFI